MGGLSDGHVMSLNQGVDNNMGMGVSGVEVGARECARKVASPNGKERSFNVLSCPAI